MYGAGNKLQKWKKLTHDLNHDLKFVYSEKATKFCEILTLLLSYVVLVKSKVKISQNFVAYMNFIVYLWFVYNHQFYTQKNMHSLENQIFSSLLKLRTILAKARFLFAAIMSTYA